MAGDWNGRLAPSHEFIFHFNRVAERARKTKEKLPESIKLSRTTLRKADGAAPGSKAASPETGMQPNKIPDSVIRVMSARGLKIDHPAVFPVDLVSEMLTAFSDSGELAFEPFCGSGTQIVAAEKDDRRCYAVEIADGVLGLGRARIRAVLRQRNADCRRGER